MGVVLRQRAINWRSGTEFHIGTEVVTTLLAIGAAPARDTRLNGYSVSCREGEAVPAGVKVCLYLVSMK